MVPGTAVGQEEIDKPASTEISPYQVRMFIRVYTRFRGISSFQPRTKYRGKKSPLFFISVLILSNFLLAKIAKDLPSLRSLWAFSHPFDGKYMETETCYFVLHLSPITPTQGHANHTPAGYTRTNSSNTGRYRGVDDS